ncbi:MAG: hypothetical protein ACKVJC_07935 [Flavobacteriales bacterium]|tara:strand:- start:1695 stop:2069 length:375 start_codon:yes stop_codon:yes gene_type:complete
MKKASFLFLLLIAFSFTGFSQEKSNTAQTEGKVELIKSKDSKEYTYILPSTVTKERVEKVSGYYTSYFTVKYNDATKEAVINMTGENKRGEMVMGRFLSSCGVQFVTIDEEQITLSDFMNTYLK